MSKRWIVVTSIGLAGCSLLVNPRADNEYDIVDSGRRDGGSSDSGGPQDGGPQDGGPRDGASDSCSLRTYYLDRDGDGFGDPATAMDRCDPPTARHAENGDDCDDSREDVHPGAAERCDDVDQDCDLAIDEGLMGPLGEPIEVVPDVGSGSSWTQTIAHERGTTVLWWIEAEDILRGSFFDRSGTTLASDVFVRGNGTRLRHATRFTIGGLDQIAVTWMDSASIQTQLCSTSGTCSAPRTVLEGDTAGLGNLHTDQLGPRVLVRWTSPDGLQVRSLDPVPPTGGASETLVLRPVPGATLTQYYGLTPVNSGEAHALVGRVAATLEDGVIRSVNAAILRVRGTAPLTHDDESDVLPWEFQDRCDALGLPTCFPAGLVPAVVNTGATRFMMVEALLASGPDGATARSACLIPFDILESGARVSGECVPLDNSAGSVFRGPLLGNIRQLGSTLGYQEVPLATGPMGADFVSLTPLDPSVVFIRSIAMHEAHGGITTGLSGRDVSLIRLGCTP